MVIVFVGTYYIYWINNRYLSGYYGRLGGPVGLNIRQYGDQNNFAMFFVISLPFIYYYGYTLKNVFFRYALWLIIPFGWHAIFLTGSRGGLLGLGVSLIPMILRSPKKIYGLLLLPAILIAFLWQGGPVMQERSATIFSEASEVDSSVQGRLDSWLAAAKMMSAHPITGVGVASFGMAYPDFSYADPKEAHNTYFQIGAESGVVAALGYILFLLSTLKALWKNMAIDGQMLIKRSDEDNFCHYMNDAVLSAWLGFGVCAMFLSLQLFEQFFYLAVLSNYIIQRKFKNYA
jgi:O-antigen ligase